MIGRVASEQSTIKQPIPAVYAQEGTNAIEGLDAYAKGNRPAMALFNLDSPANQRVTLKGDIRVEDEEAIKKISSTTVRIMGKTADGSGWYGSGSVVNPNDIISDYKPMNGEYFIITNNHVADGTKYISVRINNAEYWANVVESPIGAKLMDAENDIAILSIIAPMSLPMASIGDSSLIEQGQTVYTAGHPRALPEIVITKGVISQPRQETGSLTPDIQSDAPINPGNSGGPMITSHGDIIGTNTYTFTDGEDMTFAEPINQQLETVRAIWEKGEVVRGSLGFDVKGFPLIDRKIAGFPENESGAVVSRVKSGSAAEKAGLKPDDIVMNVEAYDQNGKYFASLKVDINDVYDGGGVIKRWAAGLLPGMNVRLKVYRKAGNDFENVEIKMPVEKLLPEEVVEDEKFGITIAKSLDGTLVISDVAKGSPAANAGLTAGKYYLRGVETDAIADHLRQYASNIHSIHKLDELMKLLSDREVDSITIKVADISNPKITRRFTITR
ncbi:MAG: trypsin-like peptidase domain-containing protein [Deltaproteobacteria bacterium]|nr:trypsin-like peptidase domain-containing protein [Deltaproteobacteria bacterium]